MVLACESIFSRTSLDGRPRNLHTFSKVNLKYTKLTFPVGQARCSFHLPHSYNLQILLARGNGASTNVEPCRGKTYNRSTDLYIYIETQNTSERLTFFFLLASVTDWLLPYSTGPATFFACRMTLRHEDGGGNYLNPCQSLRKGYLILRCVLTRNKLASLLLMD